MLFLLPLTIIQNRNALRLLIFICLSSAIFVCSLLIYKFRLFVYGLNSMHEIYFIYLRSYEILFDSNLISNSNYVVDRKK